MTCQRWGFLAVLIWFASPAALAQASAPSDAQQRAAYCVPVLEDDIASYRADLAAATKNPATANAGGSPIPPATLQAALGKLVAVMSNALSSYRDVLSAVAPDVDPEALAAARADGLGDVRRLHEIQACFATNCAVVAPATEPRTGCGAGCRDEALNRKMIMCIAGPRSDRAAGAKRPLADSTS